jgi:hypothetical protein
MKHNESKTEVLENEECRTKKNLMIRLGAGHMRGVKTEKFFTFLIYLILLH